MKTRAKCPLCYNVGDHQGIIDVKDFRNDQEYTYLRCSRCDLAFLDPLPDREELDALYNSEFQMYQKDTKGLITRLADLMAGSRETVVKSLSEKPGKILDVGCGLGVFVERMDELCWSAYGFEVSQSAAKLAKVRVGEDRIFRRWAEIPKNWFDVVSLWHVLEHVQNPLELMRKIRDSLKPGGWLVAEAPNLNSFTLRTFKNSYTQHLIPEHVLYWSERSLAYLMREEGFTISRVWHPLTMPFTFSKSLRNYIRIRGLAEIISILSMPVSFAATFIGAVMGTGETIRVCAKKVD